MEPQKRRWLRVAEAAERLGVHPRTIRKLISRRQIPYFKKAGVGIRIDWETYEAELERYKIPARGSGHGQG